MLNRFQRRMQGFQFARFQAMSLQPVLALLLHSFAIGLYAESTLAMEPAPIARYLPIANFDLFNHRGLMKNLHKLMQKLHSL